MSIQIKVRKYLLTSHIKLATKAARPLKIQNPLHVRIEFQFMFFLPTKGKKIAFFATIAMLILEQKRQT